MFVNVTLTAYLTVSALFMSGTKGVVGLAVEISLNGITIDKGHSDLNGRFHAFVKNSSITNTKQVF